MVASPFLFIGYLIDEALALGLIRIQDAGWRRGRHREDAHFPVLSLTNRGARALHDERASGGAGLRERTSEWSAARARLLAIRGLVQGADALEDYKHQHIEIAEIAPGSARLYPLRVVPDHGVVCDSISDAPHGQLSYAPAVKMDGPIEAVLYTTRGSAIIGLGTYP